MLFRRPDACAIRKIPFDVNAVRDHTPRSLSIAFTAYVHRTFRRAPSRFFLAASSTWPPAEGVDEGVAPTRASRLARWRGWSAAKTVATTAIDSGSAGGLLAPPRRPW